MTDPLTTKEIVNHDEALSLAQYKRENSNLARCYIARTLELDRLTAERDAVKAENERLREALEKLRRSHYDCEDCWYSCPKSGECCNENLGPDCNCGADNANAIIGAALAAKETK